MSSSSVSSTMMAISPPTVSICHHSISPFRTTHSSILMNYHRQFLATIPLLASKSPNVTSVVAAMSLVLWPTHPRPKSGMFAVNTSAPTWYPSTISRLSRPLPSFRLFNPLHPPTTLPSASYSLLIATSLSTVAAILPSTFLSISVSPSTKL